MTKPYVVADDLSHPIVEVVQAAEERALQLEAADAATARLYARGWFKRDGRWIPPQIVWPQLLRS